MKKWIHVLLLMVLTLGFMVELDAAGDNTYIVTYRDWNGKYITEDEVDEGQSAYFHTHIRIGYEFVGWGYDTDTLNNSVLVDVSEDRTAYAIYKPNDYVVQFLAEDGTLVLNTIMQRDSEVLPLTEELLVEYPESTVIPVVHEIYEYRRFIREDIYMNDTTLLYIEETTFELTVTVVDIPLKDGFINKGYDVSVIKEATVFYPIYEEIPIVEPPVMSEFNYQVQNNTYQVIAFTDNLNLLEAEGKSSITLPSIEADTFQIALTREELLKLRETVTTLQIPFNDATIIIPPSGILSWLLSDFTEVFIEIKPSAVDTFVFENQTATVENGFTVSVFANDVEISHYLIVLYPDAFVLVNEEEVLPENFTQYQTATYQVVSLSEMEVEEVKPDPEPDSSIDVEVSTGPDVLEQISDVREKTDSFVMENIYYMPVVVVALFAGIFAGVAILDKK